jgi:selenocysteine-specific elongation factor
LHVICTAGHVDHGKSTLVRALTGMEPDRFEEERRRGLTIDLGFAWTTLQADDGHEPLEVAFVDLPGHQRFVANMLAGAGSVTVALLVVSAEEGWMPQSQEHLEILDLLGVERGVVAITKADLVDEETLEFAVELTCDELAGTSLAGAQVVAVSSTTGSGLDELRTALRSVLSAVGDEPSGRPRLWVDRAFTVKGAGTVVTGTLRGGALSVGDEVEIQPRGVAARVRGLQSLAAAIERAPAGGRVAVNLAGVDRVDVRRGEALVQPGQWRSTAVFEAWVRTLTGREIRRRGDWHVHAGSGEWHAQVVPIIGSRIEPGRDGYLRIELEGAAPLQPGDRFVLRESGRRRTMGGGIVLDVAPRPRARGREGRAQRVADLTVRHDALAGGDGGQLLAAHAREHGVVLDDEAPTIAGLAAGFQDRLREDPRLQRLGAGWVDRGAAAGWGQALLDAVAAYHVDHPVERAAPRDVAARAATAAGCPVVLTGELIQHGIREGSLAAEGTGIRLPNHAVHLDEATAHARDGLMEILDVGGFSPPELAEAADKAGASVPLIRELEASGQLIRLEPNMAVTAATIDRAHAALREAFYEEGPLTASRAKEVLGTTRKYAMPLLEALDRLGRTRRDGDVRSVLD